MTKQDLIDLVAKEADVTKKIAMEVLDSAFNSIGDALASGRKVTLTGFGTFTVSRRSARSGVNPRNPQQRISIPAMKTPHFKAGKSLKEKVR
ncbi:MAG: DNA-binding protein [Candidatus Abawacabacteria bacterium RIFCSPHIGHO2_01_FULL_46_8]|uniref:DNA-binding protein n=1 Tax=Candidatus Abawacabacteria bacterium RIFCSPHIGHO2_01_FULL_46_8 TaxID=1817815 RepID=A0A1F4XLP2_9BACT|nr:MAG: DNA-binding protein [Candidatus Abawacabacteria bacterium RIFCSPHIGHO2_01_FULL_46_8]